ncbi:hypothetical protein Tco_0014429 [Tanacetum coccineum]
MTNKTPIWAAVPPHPEGPNAPAVVAAVVAAKVGAAAVGDGDGWRCAWADDGGGVMVSAVVVLMASVGWQRRLDGWGSV